MSDTHLPVALVTGTSSGIGRTVAHTLSGAGYRVFGTSRRATPGMAENEVELIPLDVTDDLSVAHAVSEILNSAGRLDVVVNNAGFGIAGAAEESSIAQAQALFDTNVFGVIRVVRAVLPQMRAQGSGRIVNISSVLGLLPAPFQALYAASKHALEGYSESLDHEVRDFGVRVSLIEPSYTRTDFANNVLLADETLDIYAEARAAANLHFTQGMDDAVDPAVVAHAVLAAITDAKPALRYPAGKLAKRVSTLRRYAPASMVDSGIRKSSGLNDPKASGRTAYVAR